MSDPVRDPSADAELVPLDEIRRRHVTMVLEACGGNRTNAAQVLNIDRKTLYRKLLRWGVNDG
jgi:DNA-binding protein Fis